MVQEVVREDMIKYIIFMHEITKEYMIKIEKSPNENITYFSRSKIECRKDLLFFI